MLSRECYLTVAYVTSRAEMAPAEHNTHRAEGAPRARALTRHRAWFMGSHIAAGSVLFRVPNAAGSATKRTPCQLCFSFANSDGRRTGQPMDAAPPRRPLAGVLSGRAVSLELWGGVHHSLSTFASVRQPREQRQQRGAGLSLNVSAQHGQAGEASARAGAKPSRHSTALYVPNIVTYLRLLIVIIGCMLVRASSAGR